MFRPLRPAEVKPGDALVVRGIRGQDFDGDVTFWGEHQYAPGTIVTVIEVHPPHTRNNQEDEYAFYCNGPCDGGTEEYIRQTLAASEFLGRFTNDVDVVESFLNER